MKNRLKLLLLSLISLPIILHGQLIQKNSENTVVEAIQHIANFDEYFYEGSYYDSILANPYTEGMDGTLRTKLTSLIFPKDFYGYSGISSGSLGAIFPSSEEDPSNSYNVTYFYTRDSRSKSDFTGWNREHVWPQSLSGGNWGEGKAGADLLHIRPTYNETNSQRGNLKFGYSNGSILRFNGMEYGKKDKYFEPLDSVKGDVARILMYIWVAYKNYYSPMPSITNTISDFDTLMAWHTLDKPDELEGHRNDVCFSSKQKNRNPFVDHPEFAWQIFGEECSTSVVNNAKDVYPGDNIKLTSISFDEEYICLEKYETKQLMPNFDPINATNKKLNWYSSNPSIVSVNNGLIEAKSVGQALISATSVSDPSISCYIVVDVIEPTPLILESIEVKDMTTSFDLGDEFIFDGKVIAYYTNGKTKEVTPTHISSPNMNTIGRKTISITYEENNISVSCSYFIEVNVNISTGAYVLATKVSDLKDNQKAIIVNRNNHVVAGSLGGNKFLASVEDNNIQEDTTTLNEVHENAMVFTIKLNNSSLALLDSNNKYLTSTSSKVMSFSNSFYWNYSFSENNFILSTIISDETYRLEYNSSSPRFTTYTSKSNQNPIQLFIEKEQASKSTLFANNFLKSIACDNGLSKPNKTNWNNMRNDYSSLPSEDKVILREALYTIEGYGEDTIVTPLNTNSLIAECVARYDYIIQKYGIEEYANFMNREIISLTSFTNRKSTNVFTIVIILSIAFTLSSICLWFFIKKKGAY